MFLRPLMLSVALLGAWVAGAAEEGLLLHYSFDEEAGDAADDSGNDLHGQVGAAHRGREPEPDLHRDGVRP